MYKKIIRNLQKPKGFGIPFKYCLLLLYLAVIMVVFIAAMLKLNLKRIPKQKIYMRKKENSIALPKLCMLIWTNFFSPRWDHLGGIPESSEISRMWTGSLLIHTLCFYRSFLKTVRSHLKQPT